MEDARAKRDSNLELMRIVLMLAIVAHHMAVNSGFFYSMSPTDLSAQAFFIKIWGMWGKTAINSFVLITGWFMCTSRLTWKKYVRLLAQVYFWGIVVWLALCVIYRAWPELDDFVTIVIAPLKYINGSFVASFLAMYLMIPFLNRLVGSLDRDAHLRLLALLLLIHTVATTFLDAPKAFSEFAWLCSVYLLAAYLRLHRPAWTEDRPLVSRLCLASIALSIMSVIVFMLINNAAETTVIDAYHLVSDSGKLLALTTGLLMFLWFKGLRLPRSKAINAVSATVFGVLLIHAHSDAMRALLWGSGGIFDVRHMYETCGLWGFALRSAAAVAIVFTVCSLCDMLRIRFLEPPFLRWLDERGKGIEARARGLLDAVADKLA